MNFPVSYDDVKKVEEHNKVCVMVYTTSLVEHVNKAKEEIEELEIIRDYIGNPDSYLTDTINL